MENKKTVSECLKKLQERNMFRDTQKAEIMVQIFNMMSEKEVRQITDLFKKS